MAIESVVIPTVRPLIPHSGGESCPISKTGWMKRYATKLHSESSVRWFQMIFLVLIVQSIVARENVCSRTTFAGSSTPNKLANLNDSVRLELMQLYLELA
jgi:hypothetical protein